MVYIVSILLFLSSCNNDLDITSSDSFEENDTTVVRILYVGNSLTYTNNLPEIVADIAASDSVKIRYYDLSNPNYSIEDHLNEGLVQKEIQSGKYDFVIAQQGPSALYESQLILIRDAKKLASLCSATVKTKFALMTVWPTAERLGDLDDVIYSYKNAADSSHAILCPAGLAWKIGWQMDETLPFYGRDNFHPSFTGSVLAALTVYGALF
ncbi:MAG: SGNH/GDSL hydrolase family protein [Bacteroidota bacterium]|nr:SGNH/GDSL hydrolase family protein [Bacteroidota bacterium]